MTPAKVVVVMPAYNAGRTLRMTYEELPKDTVNLVILVDDGSTDATLEIARELGLEIFVHDRNYGYGANQKTCYTEALRSGVRRRRDGAPRLPVRPDAGAARSSSPSCAARRTSCSDRASRVAAPRSSRACPGGSTSRTDSSPVSRTWRSGSTSRSSTPGYRAFSREALEAVNFRMNSDGFVFDQEIISQAVAAHLRIAEIAVPVRYFPEASSASFWASCVYGLKILWVVARYLLHRSGIKRSRRLVTIRDRYHRLGPSEPPAAR